MSKRHKLVTTSILLSLGFIVLGAYASGPTTIIGISLLSILSMILFAWSLSDALGRDATLLVLVLPPMFTFGVGIFWFLLPAALFARIPVIVLFGLGIYALAATSNIYTVAASKTIALLRAAKGVGFVLILFISFLLYDAIISLRAEVWVNALLIFATSLPLFIQGLWVSKLGREFPRSLIPYSIIGSYIISSISVMIFFWPVGVVIGSLFLTVSMYVLLGLSQARVEGRLFPQITKEYTLVGLIVFIAMFFATNWRTP